MALYYEAAEILSALSTADGSLKSRIYDSDRPLRSPPALVYGLIKECSRWDTLLSEVIDHSGILANESKVSRRHYCLRSLALIEADPSPR